tara:strand:+ start:779 stop:1954 length:1176 start_codon:yes stop_codon:yes gene_type:complete
MKTVFILLFIFLTISKSSISEIIYSGLTLQGKFSDNEINYKYFYPFYINNKKEINTNLFQIFKNKKNIVAKKSANKSALVLSLSIGADSVAIYNLEKGITQYNITFFPEVSIYDNSTKEIINSLGGIATAFYNTDKKLNVSDLYKEYYLNNLKLNMVDKCTNNETIQADIYTIFEILYDCIDTNKKYKNNLKLNIKFNPELKKQFSKTFSNQLTEQAIINSVGHRVTSILSMNSAIEQNFVIPYSKDQKITGVLKRFSDTTQISIKLPSPDYVIDTELIGFKRIIKNEDKDQIHSLYASGAIITVLEPFSGTILFKSKFKNIQEKFEPITMKSLNENQKLNSFYRTISFLYLDAFSNIFAEKPNKKYFDKYSYSDFKDIKVMHKLLKNSIN